MTAGRDQIALLTTGYDLPVTPFSDIQLGMICKAVETSWRSLVAGGFDKTAIEPEVVLNAGLVIHLQRLIDGKDGELLRTIVSHVSRGAEHHVHDGSAFEKRPDINLYLTDRRSPLPFCGECKIIDEATRKGIGLYDRCGIRRFKNGEYNWLFSQGFMVAYVRDTTNTAAALTTICGQPPRLRPYKGLALFETTHDRSFAYLNRNGKAAVPGPISLLHLWLSGVPRGLHRPRRPGRPSRRKPSGLNSVVCCPTQPGDGSPADPG